MENIPVDEPLRSKLMQFSKPVNLCDSTGAIIGSFFPHHDPSMYEPVTPLTREELNRRMQAPDPEWFTTEEVLSHLEKL
ncbi:MAG TPA: hypothetical protein VK137_00150 [Planctomycetaceae bacterium]|nr:hypothetical protein [Planctomycetaceae bacterium]